MPEMLPKSKIPKLLGKWRDQYSKKEVRGFWLIDHIAQCVRETQDLLDVGFLQKLHRMLRLETQVSLADFKHLCTLAVFVHDLGKSSQEFQHMLWMKEHVHRRDQNYKDAINPAPYQIPDFYQHTRHEFISYWLLTAQDLPGQTGNPIRAWLEAEVQKCASVRDTQDAFWVVVAAAFGHHRKTDRLDNKEKGRAAHIYLSKLTPLLHKLSQDLGMGAFPRLEDVLWNGKWHDISPESAEETAFAKRVADAEETPFSIAVKWVTVLSDVLGSLTPRGASDSESDSEYALRVGTWGARIKEYLTEMMAPVDTDYLERVVLAKREQQPKEKNFQSKRALSLNLRTFQKESATGESTLLVASCGGGKSIAAFNWASRFPDKKLIYTLPTTGTASQLYIDYQGDRVRHSRAWLDLKLQKSPIFNSTLSQNEDTDSQTPEGQPAQSAHKEIENNFSFGVVDSVNFSTIDQLLGCLTFNHKSILWLLVLVDSVIVFDEFHSYDPGLRAHLAQFLKWFPDTPFLAMTATSTAAWQSFWKDARPTLKEVTSQEDVAKSPRYRIHIISRGDADNYFQDRALWIVNQVRLAQEIGTNFPDCIVYHSRFTYEDRKGVQSEMVRAFRDTMHSVRAVATQVAQMSLDISGKIGIIEACPIEDFIQRLGRINRGLEFGISDVYVYAPEKALPYWPETEGWRESNPDFKRLWAWLQTLDGRVMSQDDLKEEAKALELASFGEPAAMEGRLLKTFSRPTRQIDHQSAPILVNVSREQVAKMTPMDIQLAEISVPMSKKVKQYPYEKFHFLVPWHYDTRLGLVVPQ